MSELLDTCVLVYMDDILIFSKSAQEHRQHVMQVFEKLNAHNWHIKSKKCALFLPEVEFLGYVVSADSIKVAQTKVDAVAQWPVPTCVRDVQAFLGLANFYRRFVRRFADIARPLTDLTRKDIEFVWTAECAASFETLKTALTTAPVLQVFDDAKPSELWVDAS